MTVGERAFVCTERRSEHLFGWYEPRPNVPRPPSGPGPESPHMLPSRYCKS
jgi:hypothetical protein